MPTREELDAAARVVEQEIDRRWPAAALVKGRYRDPVRDILWRALQAAEAARRNSRP